MKKLNDLAQLIEESMQFWGVPGTTVSITYQDEELLAQAFGCRDVDNRLPVSRETVFPIGSITKSFTAVASALMADRQLLDWDRPLVEFLPDFKMFDEMAAKRLTMTDLLSHRSGLPPHNKFWYGSYFSRQELFERMKFLEPAWDIRTQFCYHNLNYLLAGAIIERLSGMSWEEFIKKNILDPLKMSGSSMKKSGLTGSSEYALPYKQVEDELKTFPILDIDACAPAGALNMNMSDLQNWSLFNLNKGTFEGNRIISESKMGKIWEIHQGNAELLPFSFKEIPYISYGLGCYVMPYRGLNMILQGGNIEGYVAASFLLPDENLCINIQANMHEANLFLLSNGLTIVDRLLDLSPIDWNKQCIEQIEKFTVEMEAAARQDEAVKHMQKLNTRPSHELEAFTGRYEHPAYGELRVELRNGNLVVVHNNNTALLKYFEDGSFNLHHFHYNTFKGNIMDLVGPYHGLINFNLGKDGEIASVEIPFETLVSDIVFVKRTN